LGPEFEALGWLYRNRITLTEACAIAGDRDGAMQTLQEADASPHATFSYHHPHRMLAQAWIWACEGATSMAIDHARRAAEYAAARDQYAQEVLCLQAATLFGDATTSLRLAELAERVDGPRAPTAALHAAALAAGDGGGLLAASKRYEAMGDVLSAADAAAQASVIYSQRGLRGSALTAASRVQHFVEQCGMVRTPALAAFTAPAKLTGRQREIIALAAQGLTNRQICQRLHLSVRTVEGHLHRAAAKVGTSDRVQLGRLLQGDTD
jgi:DNA-binding NarL/FixJ family response regulator